MTVALKAEVCNEISERKGEVMNGIEGKSLAFLIGVGIGWNGLAWGCARFSSGRTLPLQSFQIGRDSGS